MFDIKCLKSVLEKKISGCDRVVIIPHNNADFDAIGSALAVSLIAKNYNKDYVIIENDPPHIIESGVKMIMNECEGYNILKKDKYLKTRKEEKELFVLVDVNKKNLICVDDLLPNQEDVIIVDHHDPDNNTVNSSHIFIDSEKSSACEILVELLLSMKIDIPSDIANYLYAGIYLDTAKLTKNCKADTMKMAAKLLENGADIAKVNEYFKEDYKSDRRVQNLISNIKITSCMIALIKGNDDVEYTREELAKAADYSLKYGVDAAFTIGRIDDNTVSVSGRAVDKINVGTIMYNIGKGNGGGSPYSGAAKANNETVDEVSKRLIKELTPSYFISKEEKEK